LLSYENKAKLSVGVGCDLVCEKCCASILTNASCSSSDFSCLSDEFSCGKSLLVENELLKKEVVCLTYHLRKCYNSRAQFNHCWTNKKFTLNKQGFEYIPKKGKEAFVQTKTIFVKNRGCPFCEKCKKVGHDKKNCTNKKAISFDSRYVLMNNSSGNIYTKFVGLPIDDAKKNAIWVPKVLVTNIQRPKKVWVPKRANILL
jgi:hypothetical protein